MGEAWATVECTGRRRFLPIAITGLEETGDFDDTTDMGLMGLRFDLPGKRENTSSANSRTKFSGCSRLCNQGGQATGVGVEGEGRFPSLEERLPALREEALSNALKNAPFKQCERVDRRYV